MFTPGSGSKFLFATLGGRLLEVGDCSNRGYYSNKYGYILIIFCSSVHVFAIPSNNFGYSVLCVYYLYYL